MNTTAAVLQNPSQLPGEGLRDRRDNVVATGVAGFTADGIPPVFANHEPPATKYRLDPARAAIVRTAPPLVMDLKEASAYLVCSTRKLRDLVATRRVRSARIGAKIVIRRSWLDAFLGGPL